MAYDYKNIKVFKKSQVGGLTKHVAGLRWKEEFRQPNSYNSDMDKVINHLKTLGLEIDYNNSHLSGEKFTFTKARKITKEQSDFGKAWLKDFFFNLKGQPRKGQRTEYVSDRVLAIAKNVSRFEFVGVLMVMDNSHRSIMQVLPVYRTYNRRGQYFDYAPVHWGQPVIMEG
jgi:hypothetical protein